MKDRTLISSNTQICAVIGNPIEHTLSPAIHNAAFEHMNLDFVYLACKVEDVKNALAGMRAFGNFRGMSVTIPHKIEAMKYLDEINVVDRTIGSINTVIHQHDKLIGFGTDGPGALKALVESGVELDGKNVLMLGSGGAARAISFTLARNTKPNELLILDVNKTMLDGLADDLKNGTDVFIKAEPLNERSLANAMMNADIIIHCTPIGMSPKKDASLIPIELFRHGQVVFDIVYTPLETKLLADAKSRGLKVISGVDMFINQAVLQFEQFTGKDAPIDVMRGVVMENLKS